MCQYYLSGNCAYGDRCRYDHVRPADLAAHAEKLEQQQQQRQQGGTAAGRPGAAGGVAWGSGVANGGGGGGYSAADEAWQEESPLDPSQVPSHVPSQVGGRPVHPAGGFASPRRRTHSLFVDVSVDLFALCH